MSCWITYSSKYFHTLSITTDQQRQTLSTLICSAVEYIERYCNRKFEEQEHDEVKKTQRDGSIILQNFPVAYISRLCFSSYDWLSIRHASAQRATWSTTQDKLQLRSVSSGVTTNTSLTLSNYATLSSLATAITDAGWVATVTSGYELYPADDLVPFQYGSATSTAHIPVWDDWTGDIDFDQNTGILHPGFGDNQLYRCVYTAGFNDVPEPLKQVAANLTTNAYNGNESKLQSETIGDYSYTLADVDSLPISDKKVLALYKDRRC